MENLESLAGVIVHTGRSDEIDSKRLYAALNYKPGVNLLITGLGPDANRVVFPWGQYKPGIGGPEAYDFHFKLWNEVVDKHKEGKIGYVCVDINSVNSKQNLMNTFPLRANGTYAIFSDPLHLLRMRFLKGALQITGRMSKEINLLYVPIKKISDLSLKEIGYEVVALIKAFFKVWF